MMWLYVSNADGESVLVRWTARGWECGTLDQQHWELNPEAPFWPGRYVSVIEAPQRFTGSFGDPRRTPRQVPA
jgi:hypothetical protein